MKHILFSIVCISLVSTCFAKADVSDKNAQLIKVAKDGKSYKEERFSITFDLDNGSNTVASITLKESNSFTVISIERPGDFCELAGGVGGVRTMIGVGEGSEIRFLGMFERVQGKVTGQKNSRLSFRKADGKWAYVSGLGQYDDHGKITKLGYDRTVDACLDLLRSKDLILREGGARDLGRICTFQDAGRVVPQLVVMLKDASVPVWIRRGAIEGLGLIGTADTTKALLIAYNEETDAMTKKFIEEALGFCAAYSILGEPGASEKPTDVGLDRLLGKKDGKEDSLSNTEKKLNDWVKDNLIRRIDVRQQEAMLALDKASGSPEIKIAETAAMLKKELQLLEKAGAKESNAVTSDNNSQSAKPAKNDDKDKNIQLGKAAENGNLSVVQKLLAEGADVNLKGPNGITALYIASQQGHVEVVKLLLEKGADVNAKMTDGSTVLYIASQQGHVEAVKLLLEKGADVNAKMTNGATALIVASQEGHAEVVKPLLEKGADVNAKMTDGSTALLLAANNGRVEVVKLLLEKRADVNAKVTTEGVTTTALVMAAMNGHVEIVKLLLEKGADVNVKDTTNGYTALMAAAGKGHMSVVKLLLKKGADVNAKMTDGSTALFIAAEGHTDVVKLLLEKGADANAKLTDGRTALFIAAQNGHVEVVKLLLEKGADINAKNTNGATALMITIAAKDGHMEIVKLLLEKGAEINASTKTGGTALILASVNGHTEVVKLLLEAKADINAKLRKGEKDYTALSIAKEMGRTDIVQLLEKAGAKE